MKAKTHYCPSLNSIKYIAKFISANFAKQMTNALLLSKINYNIDVWGSTTKHNTNKIDNIMEKAARTILGKQSLGRTRQWLFTKLKWLNTENNCINTTQNYIYKQLNNKEEHYVKYYLTKNRSIRHQKQNKVGTHDPSMGFNQYTQRTFLYRAINIYNTLPRNITLIKINNHIQSSSILKKTTV